MQVLSKRKQFVFTDAVEIGKLIRGNLQNIRTYTRTTFNNCQLYLTTTLKKIAKWVTLCCTSGFQRITEMDVLNMNCE